MPSHTKQARPNIFRGNSGAIIPIDNLDATHIIEVRQPTRPQVRERHNMPGGGFTHLQLWGATEMATRSDTRIITSSYVIAELDTVIFADAVGGVIDVTLPSASSSKGRILHIQKTNKGANSVRVISNDLNLFYTTEDLINLFSIGDSTTLQSDGVTWQLVASQGTVGTLFEFNFRGVGTASSSSPFPLSAMGSTSGVGASDAAGFAVSAEITIVEVVISSTIENFSSSGNLTVNLPYYDKSAEAPASSSIASVFISANGVATLGRTTLTNPLELGAGDVIAAEMVWTGTSFDIEDVHVILRYRMGN